MKPEDRERWLEYVGKEIGKVEAVVSTSAEEIKQARESSDIRENPAPVWAAQDQVDKRNGGLKSLKDFQEELQKVGPTDIVEPGAQVKVYLDGVEEELLVMRTKVKLPDTQVITLDTPLVDAIKGQQIAFSTTYEVGEIEHTVQILEIH